MSNELSKETALVIVCAHHSEAESSIEALKLKRLHGLTHFAVFANQHYALIESGQGATNAACAVGHMAGLLAPNNPAWINIGVAGHASRNIGDLLIAHRIVDNNSGESHFPATGLFRNIDSTSLRSFATVNLNYSGDEAYDMEAWSFFAAAARFSNLESIQSIKIISDNAEHPACDLSDKSARKHIAELIRQHQATITKIAETMADEVFTQRKRHRLPDVYSSLLAHYHFTENQKFQLQQLLRQLQMLSPTTTNDIMREVGKALSFKNSRQLLEHLQQRYLELCEQHYSLQQ